VTPGDKDAIPGLAGINDPGYNDGTTVRSCPV
jgi:hypothetical protein